MNRKIGLYGGSFDPIHIGHLNLAIQISEACQLDEVWFCPAQSNPFKQDSITVPIVHRHRMVKDALADFPHFKVIDIEANSPGPSYTIHTLLELLKKNEKEPLFSELSLIIGDDNLSSFHKWHQAEEIVKLVPIYVGSRLGALTNIPKSTPFIESALRKGLIQTKIFDISATEIRNRIQIRLNCHHLLLSKTIDYITSHHLYF